MAPARRNPQEDAEAVFGSVLRGLRQDRQMSQEELAQACERAPEYISLLERGKKSPTLRTLLRLADALEYPLSKIISRIEKQLG